MIVALYQSTILSKRRDVLSLIPAMEDKASLGDYHDSCSLSIRIKKCLGGLTKHALGFVRDDPRGCSLVGR